MLVLLKTNKEQLDKLSRRPGHPCSFALLKEDDQGMLRLTITEREAVPEIPDESARTVGPLEVDPRTATARLRGDRVPLTNIEFRLLEVLSADPGKVFRKEDLMRTVWGYTSGKTRTLDSHAARLRAKLREAGDSRFVVNVWGIGYKLWDAPKPLRAVA